MLLFIGFYVISFHFICSSWFLVGFGVQCMYVSRIELFNLSFHHPPGLWVCAIVQLDDVAMPTYRTNDVAQCRLPNIQERPCQLAQMYRYDRNRQRSPQVVPSTNWQRIRVLHILQRSHKQSQIAIWMSSNWAERDVKQKKKKKREREKANEIYSWKWKSCHFWYPVISLN